MAAGESEPVKADCFARRPSGRAGLAGCQPARAILLRIGSRGMDEEVEAGRIGRSRQGRSRRRNLELWSRGICRAIARLQKSTRRTAT